MTTATMPDDPSDTSLDDLLDRLVAEYSDRRARSDARGARDLLAQVPEAHRPALERCFRMIDAGLASAPRKLAFLAPGVELDGFRIEREIGRGGMSIVYVATQLELRRKVALKVLRPGLAVEPRHVDRFKREALAIARLQHPHIVQVYAVGEDLGWAYIAMELVEGRDLAAAYAELAPIPAKQRTPHDLARACGAPSVAELGPTYEAALAGLLAPVARAIGVAHELGIVHRDVKPSNVLIGADGRALVADFGLAKGDGDPALSLTGEPLGTPSYMSPEQAEASSTSVDERTDVYSLGVTFYEGLAGRRPFDGTSALQVLDQVRTQTPPPVSHFNPRASADAIAVTSRAMEHDRERRHARMLDLASDLSAIAEMRPTAARAQQRGAWRVVGRFAQAVFLRRHFEFRSSRTLFGWPLVHVHVGPRAPLQRARVAKGWLAVGDVAVGFLAFGSFATGVYGFGAITASVIGLGGISLSVVAIGGLAMGWDATGGVALALHSAVGGAAIAQEYAAGGYARAAHVISAAVRDPEAVEHFRQQWAPFGRMLLAIGRR